MTTKLDLKKIRDKEYGCNSCTIYETCYHNYSEANNFGKCFERYLRLCQTIALQEIAEALKPEPKESKHIPTLAELAIRFGDRTDLAIASLAMLGIYPDKETTDETD